MKFDLLNKIEAIKEITVTGLPFMEGRENGKVDINKVYTIKDYGYLVDGEKKEEYVCFTVKEDDLHFFYGGSIVTDNFKKMDTIVTEDEMVEILQEGLTISFDRKKSANKREYTVCTFFPKAE